MTKLSLLPTFSRNFVHLVVETPRGGSVRFSYSPELEAFKYDRQLPAGIVYPYDWGFIPSTLGEDGDPLDGMVIHAGSCFPGTIVICRLAGMLRVEQCEEAKTQRNDRFILRPCEDEDNGLDVVPRPLRQQIEQFFQASVLGTGKILNFRGWHGPADAQAAIRQGQKAFESKAKKQS
jgi:inorganic pyrophosphatase